MGKTIIKSEQELRDKLRNSPRSVVMFGKTDCLHCSIVETILESVEPKYPLIDFLYVLDKEMAERRHIDAFPVVVFYENGSETGRLIGSGKITLIKEMLNLWFYKE